MKSLKERVKSLAQEVTESLTEDEIKDLERQLEQLEVADKKGDAKTVWKLINKLAGRNTRRLLKVRPRMGAATEKNILSEWRRYFSDLLNPAQVSPDLLRREEQPQPQSNAQFEMRLPPASFNISDFSSAEVEAAIRSMKNNKSPGVDSFVKVELLKDGGDFVREILRSLCNKILSGADPPLQWTTSKIVPIPKKGDLSQMANYRGISLMSVAAKLYNRLLLERLRPIVDPILRKNQAGFRRGRSTIDQVCALRRIFESAETKQLPLVATFVDFRKAFDSVNREKLFEILNLYGVPEKLINAVKALYRKSKAVVVVNGKETELRHRHYPK